MGKYIKLKRDGPTTFAATAHLQFQCGYRYEFPITWIVAELIVRSSCVWVIEVFCKRQSWHFPLAVHEVNSLFIGRRNANAVPVAQLASPARRQLEYAWANLQLHACVFYHVSKITFLPSNSCFTRLQQLNTLNVSVKTQPALRHLQFRSKIINPLLVYFPSHFHN